MAVYEQTSYGLLIGRGPYVVINFDSCIVCTQCEPECPDNAIRIAHGSIDVGDGPTHGNDYLRIYPERCTLCGECANVCPTDALQFLERLIPPPPPPDDEGGGGGGGNPTPDKFKKFKDFYQSAQPIKRSQADEFFLNHNVKSFENVVNAVGMANGVQSLNHTAINALITATGGVAGSDVLDVVKSSGLGKMAVVGVAYNVVKTVLVFSDGEITGDDWKQLGTTLLGVAGFASGPVGWIATGVSLGISIFNAVND